MLLDEPDKHKIILTPFFPFSFIRGMKLPKIENDDHILISSSKGNRISYKSDEKLRFQVNVNRLLNVKSYLNEVLENENEQIHKENKNIFPKLAYNQHHHNHQQEKNSTVNNIFNTRHPTKLPPIKK